ncbi:MULTISPECIES: sensor domain-containing diguanylate cyclase [Mycolicibacterium]|uniref:GGDEF domain-containing protein n=1 Tax=Mycolicibacterium TaxID=1866885 RepID=UPI0023BA9CB9|nr:MULTISPECIES: GGDEF domain-containing protein [Mycolicibacterium]MDW5613322.1 GGDEF domain-containing protein [Mycolicibacterium sp. D5.8-2]
MQWDQRRVDHYEWFSGFLDARGAKPAVRLLIASIALLMSASVLLLMLSAGSPEGQPQRAMMWLSVAGGVAGVTLWLWHWPSRLQSAAFATLTAFSVALACLAYPDPLAALLGCIAFTTNGAYLAFFHTTRLLLGNIVIAIGVATVESIQLAAQGRIALAAVDLFLVVQINIAVPLAIRILLHALRGDLHYADHDPLTGLLNRRAFRRQILSLLARSHGEGRYLVVALMDLDHFKALNDARGHIAGDQALIAVADALRTTATSTAVVARSGGEEFLIADVTGSPSAAAHYQQVCDAITALPVGLTASIGTAVAALRDVPVEAFESTIDRLVSAADMAMYRAKRNGGNQCHHLDAWPPPGPA